MHSTHPHREYYDSLDTFRPNKKTSLDDFDETDIAKDLGNYKSLSQVALHHKIQKWQKTIDDIKNRLITTEDHLHLYGKDLNPENIFRRIEFVRTMGQQVSKQTLYKTNKDWWQYYIDNFQRLLNETIDYYNEFKERERPKRVQSETQNEKILCECGGYYTKRNKSKHMTTSKHTDYLAK